MKKLLSLLLISFAIPSFADEWRHADYEDVINDWAVYDNPSYITADFNGDGVLDAAEIMVSKNNDLGFLVKVVVNEKDYVLLQRDDLAPQSYSLEVAMPSNETWESACEKGYWDCEEGEIRQFKILKPSILGCYIESACSVFMWSERNKNFIEIPISD